MKRPYRGCILFGTGTIGVRISDETNLAVARLKSGPFSGEAQIGAMITEGRLDTLIFFIDPLSAPLHDVDMKSLLWLAILYDMALAVNEETATRLIASAQK